MSKTAQRKRSLYEQGVRDAKEQKRFNWAEYSLKSEYTEGYHSMRDRMRRNNVRRQRWALRYFVLSIIQLSVLMIVAAIWIINPDWVGLSETQHSYIGGMFIGVSATLWAQVASNFLHKKISIM